MVVRMVVRMVDQPSSGGENLGHNLAKIEDRVLHDELAIITTRHAHKFTQRAASHFNSSFHFVLGKLSYLTWYTAAPSFHNPYALEARFVSFLCKSRGCQTTLSSLFFILFSIHFVFQEEQVQL